MSIKSKRLLGALITIIFLLLMSVMVAAMLIKRQNKDIAIEKLSQAMNIVR